MSYLDLSIKDIHEAILNHEVTPIELVKEALERAHNDKHNSFECILDDEALEAVNNLASKDKNNIFYGIPIVIKDNYSTKDIETTASSNILKGYIPVFDAEVVTRLKEAGAIIIGKTTMDELAMGGTGTTGHLGKQTNPWDAERMVGGSSSGCASSIASGVTPFALGSDTGDSVRKPASYVGSIGFKPTWGRISRFGLFPFAPSLDTVAYFTRNVYDAAISLNVLAGRDNKDMASSSKEVEDYTSKLFDTIKGKKICVISGILDSFSNEKVKNLFLTQLDKLKEAGAEIIYEDIDKNLLLSILPTYYIISSCEATSNTASLDGIKFGNRIEGDAYEDVVINTRTQGFSERIKRRFVIGSYSLLKENREELFIRAKKSRRMIVDAFNEALKKCDAIYLPASSSVAPYFKDIDNVDKLSDEYLIADNFMAYANFAGLPSITLPLGFIDGLPIGANLTSKIFDEVNLLSIASNVERIIGLKNLLAKEEE
ncbi:MAG: Asp-tRNA(Asn)/Glu-tRNA(Gln) amidotransferase subunit GatA [Erysipelotrichaceae bacterium]|nr:Asp-tRNA(Asn)/Glu-tRNA(Gln) amidotransferase subunit GatA [Erysipelotrichaceae bacterium]